MPQVARKAEQSDVEGLLLRAGAHDPSGRDMPVVSESFPPEGTQESPQTTTPDSEVEELAHVKSPAKPPADAAEDAAGWESHWQAVGSVRHPRKSCQRLNRQRGTLIEGTGANNMQGSTGQHGGYSSCREAIACILHNTHCTVGALFAAASSGGTCGPAAAEVLDARR